MTNTTEGRSASKGIITGFLVTPTMDAIRAVRAEHGEDAPLVLFATMTTPDDMPVIAECDALVSTTGGITCHTAVVAREWQLPAVVGASDLDVKIASGTVVLDGVSFNWGHNVTVNGTDGTITFN